MSCGVGCRCSSDLALLWLCPRPVATAVIGPLAWESPNAVCAALKRQKDKKKQTTNQTMNTCSHDKRHLDNGAKETSRPFS